MKSKSFLFEKLRHGEQGTIQPASLQIAKSMNLLFFNHNDFPVPGHITVMAE